MEKKQFYNYLEDSSLLNENTLAATKQLTTDFPWFQSAWMLYLRNLKNINSEAFDGELKKVAILVPERKNLFKYLNSQLPTRKVSIEKLKAASTLYQLEGHVELSENNSLIDKFLSSDTGASRKKRNFAESSETFDAKTQVNKSIAENDELITETLATIYFQQKNYEKAQEAYQKLSLKYPEKSVYFAARIKEIEVLKQNN